MLSFVVHIQSGLSHLQFIFQRGLENHAEDGFWYSFPLLKYSSVVGNMTFVFYPEYALFYIGCKMYIKNK